MQCEDDETDRTTESRGPIYAEEFSELAVAMEWQQWQNSVDPVQLLLLKRLRDMAAVKIISYEYEAEDSQEFLFTITINCFLNI